MSVRVYKAVKPRQLSEVVKVELHPEWSRETGTVKAAEVIDLGEVLAKLDEGANAGQLVQWNPAGADGSGVIVGVSQAIVEAGTTAPVEGVVYSARGTVVAASGLRWKAGTSDANKAVARAALAALGIIAR